MTTAGFGPQAARRRKWIAGLVAGALTATVLTVVVAYWWSGVRKDKPLSAPQTLPTNVHQQLSGYSFTRSDEGRRIFTVHAARTVAFKQGGTTVLEDVFVEFFGRTGDHHDVLRTRRCDYNAQSGDLFSSGKVEIELNAQAGAPAGAGLRGRQPVYVETSQVSFRQLGSLVVSEEPVRFRIGPSTGSARGVTYATKGGWLELHKEVAAELRPRGGPNSQPPTKLSASRLRYDKESGEVVLWGPLEITQGNRRVVAGRGTVSLDEQNRVTQAILETDVRASDSSVTGVLEGRAQRVRGNFDPASGQLRNLLAEGDVEGESKRGGSVSHLVAQLFQMTFAGAHPQPQSGGASGNVRLTLESSPATNTESAAGRLSVERRNLAANQVRFAFQPGGQALKEAQTVGAGELVLVPRDPKLGERVITAGQFLMAFDSRGRLEILRGLSPTRIVFRPPKQAPPGTLSQESSSERLEAKFDPATQTLRAVEQAGDFQFREGDRQASSEQAHYGSPTQVMTLTGHPQVWDASTRIRAERILLDFRTDTAEGVGKVQSTHFDAAARPANAPQLPTNVLADRMLAQRQSQVVHYEGHVRVWHGQDVVESSSLDVYRAERRVRSGSRVLTSHLQPASAVPGTSSASPRETRPVTIRADQLEYFDQGRKASYRGHVQLQTENTTLQADHVDVYFSAAQTVETSEVERAVADGHVTVVQPARRASGEHAEYFAGPGKILLTGGPPTLYDAEKGFTTGQRLTFFIHDDTIFVDGGDESQTLSKHRIAQ